MKIKRHNRECTGCAECAEVKTKTRAEVFFLFFSLDRSFLVFTSAHPAHPVHPLLCRLIFINPLIFYFYLTYIKVYRYKNKT